MWSFLNYRTWFVVLLLSLAVSSAQAASCLTVNRNQLGTNWSIVDKPLERWVYRNYHYRVNFTCTEWGAKSALCMPDWMRGTPGMGGANPMTFCSVNIGTSRQVYLVTQPTVDRWLRVEKAKRPRGHRHPYKH